MKRLIFLLVGSLLFFISSHQVLADDSWVIENFQSQIAIQQSGVVKVVETISVDFRDNPQHGIYRDIPYLYTSDDKQTYTQVKVVNVLQNNVPVQYTITQTNGYEEIRIGDPNKTVVGRNVYTIAYTVIGVLHSVNNYDELYWNVTGNDWPVGIEKAEATISLPEEGIERITCYEGFIGSQKTCQSNLDSPSAATFATTDELANNDGLTVVVDYKKGLIPFLTAEPPKSYWEQLVTLPSMISFIVIFLTGAGFIGFVWYKYGRDYWFAGKLFGTKKQKGKVKPIGAHETISVEFTPPEKLRPAQIGVLMDERADTLDVAATIIDLATRGYLTITELSKKWKFGKVNYLLTKESSKKSDLLVYEKLLLDKIFYKRRQVKLSTLKTTFYTDLKQVKQSLYADVVSKSFFQSDPEEVRKKYFFVASILLIGGLSWIWYGFDHSILFFGDGGVGCIVDGLLLFIVSRYMPRRTAYGRELYRRSKGYYLFIDRAERYRQRYFEKENMFNEVLPYAIVFGLTKKFAKQMQKIGAKPTQTNWYISQQPFVAGVFVGNIHDFSHSLSSAMASTLSNSGGFSGGSAGGGFGGGGGGSW